MMLTARLLSMESKVTTNPIMTPRPRLVSIQYIYSVVYFFQVSGLVNDAYMLRGFIIAKNVKVGCHFHASQNKGPCCIDPIALKNSFRTGVFRNLFFLRYPSNYNQICLYYLTQSIFLDK